MTGFGIPLTGSMSAIGFTLGFLKGWYEDDNKKYGFPIKVNGFIHHHKMTFMYATTRPNTIPYITCPLKLAIAGRWPSGWFHAEYPVMGLWIGTRVRIHNIKPYKIPNKENDITVKEKECDRKETMYGNAIPAKAPFKKWKKKIPLK